MIKKLLFGLLILTLIAVPLFATACEEEVTPPGEEEEEEGPPGEEEEEEGNWWDDLGEPKYGGTITIAADYFAFWDPYLFFFGTYMYYLENLLMPDWTLDPEIWAFNSTFVPEEYCKGMLAESWEMTDPQTITFNIRQGVYWQDKPPVNGREFTAYDVEYAYDRVLGTGSGFTGPCPFYMGRTGALQKVTATDKYTAVFEFSIPAAWNFYAILEQGGGNRIEPPETAEPEAPLTDWHNAVGTGPWILTDYVEGASMTFSKNPNYWGYDERYPENQLPYADELTVLMIPDLSTRLAALRTGQTCFIDGIDWQQAGSLADTNPELQQAKMPFAGQGLDFRVDHEPFTDIRVRKALQMALDRETLAQSYFGGAADEVPAGWTSPIYKGFCFAYEDWPQELKDEYSYNPERASQLLAEAAADGVFEPNDLGGFDTNVVIASTADVNLAQVVQSYFLDIGVDMEINVMEGPAFSAFTMAYKHDQMYWQTGGNTGATIPPDMAVSMCTSTNMSNYGRINDPVYDALFSDFQSAMTTDEAKLLLIEMDRYVLEHHWGLRTVPIYTYNIWQPYLKGYSGEAISVSTSQPGGWIWARLWID